MIDNISHNCSLNTRNSRCLSCTIRQFAFCKVLQEDELLEFSNYVDVKTYSAGTTIVEKDAEVSFLGTILKGIVKLEQLLPDGRVQIVGLLKETNFIGQPIGNKSAHYMTAVSDVQICSLRRDEFYKMGEKYHLLEHNLFEQAMNALAESQNWITVLGQKSAKEKVASLILNFYDHEAIKNSNDDNFFFELPLNRREIAEFLGLTEETVSRQLTALRKSAVIGRVGRSRYQVISPDVLRKIAQCYTDQ